jgi:ATP-dependent Clp protease ATP-binding subunit ClpC
MPGGVVAGNGHQYAQRGGGRPSGKGGNFDSLRPDPIRVDSPHAMFERYTESARRALFFARYEVTQLGGRAIETEHLLLGLIRSPTLLVERIFANAHVSTSAVRADIAQRFAHKEKVPTSVEIPFTEDAKRALELAAREADDLRRSYIGTEHLLLGLLRLDKSVAGSVLIAHGLRLTTVREDVERMLTEPLDMPALPEDDSAMLAHIVAIQQLFEQFAKDAVARGSSADDAQVILEEFEALKRRFEV